MFLFCLVFGILGQVWYLIVSIPDLCALTYFAHVRFSQDSSMQVNDK